MPLETDKNTIDPKSLINLPDDFDPEDVFGINVLENTQEPIPSLTDHQKRQWADLEWKKVPISNNEPAIHEEPLTAISSRLLISPRYFERDMHGSAPEIFLRASVAARLKIIDNALKKINRRVLVWDGWRSMETQAALFMEFLAILRAKFPQYDEDRLIKETQKYVSIPSQNPFKPSPHVTGGAVDWTIATPDGKPVNMGCKFDEFEAVAQTRYFETLDRKLNPAEEEAKKNRRLHFWVANNVGLANYPEEFWHSSNGDQMWGMSNGTKAFFGPAPFDTLGKLLEPIKPITANIGGQKQVFYMNLSDTGNAGLYLPTRHLNGIDGVSAKPFTRINYPFQSFESAQHAIALTNRAVRALYEADSALNGQRELTRAEIIEILRSSTGVVPFEKAA